MTRSNLAKALFLGLSLTTATLSQGAQARPDPAALDRNEIKRLVVEEAEGTSLPPSLALALAKVESDFQGAALSEKGARGVMQIMPRTARTEFGVAADELWNPRLNIQLGLSFLEQLIERYGGRWDLALSHYNGGSLRGSGAAAQAHGYTKRYVQTVLRWQERYAAQAVVWRAGNATTKESWTPARTAPAAVVDISERDAEAERRFHRRARLIRKDRAARRVERHVARAEHQRRRLAQRQHRSAPRNGWRHKNGELDDFTPGWRHWRHAQDDRRG
ncbi:MAG: lytic transglycosylase domain-containing protein [Rhodospirillaceae bacterium]|jgi:hypothetical protein|nr:lytic transglycosylase domain-containing protein [Rhodospirillaceae bacterium]MBT5191626.1 lytic transglycosylase domain-containing protein [Rhodospirillaceae bacterium]MBT5896705.1 lytic transglycosylase domain-containing protein [Rhodospirillaceae bacterium]MBT6429005.1 lytic transglycosylase domain-containing protein [Rhodospirillaceae bacterium]